MNKLDKNIYNLGVVMDAISIIYKQKQGKSLSKNEIDYLVNGYVSGDIPDYQMSAYLMAVCFTGLDDKTLSHLTLAMAESGDMIDLSKINGVVVDKHSTGGVGDKTTLIIAPIVAACGGKVAKMSGRGLGHTGGTIDKFESIPGFKTELSLESFIDTVNVVGVSVVGQMRNLTPADKKIYAIRDVTATVDSIPLIASSVMSKKIASGADAIVLDVKYGSGAFVKTVHDAKVLGGLMQKIGESNGRRVKVLISDMSEPLGCAVGNSIEVIEAVEMLKGKGPKDLYDLCIKLSASMLELSFCNLSYNDCEKMVLESIESGRAFEKLCELVRAQGGDIEYIKNTSLFEKPKYIREVKSARSGIISSMNTEQIGNVAGLLGAGRKKLSDKIDYSAGLYVKMKIGDSCKKGDVVAVLMTNNVDVLDEAENMYIDSLNIK